MFDIFQLIKQIKTCIKKKDALLIGVLIVAYFATRLINLDALPIFGDEGIYIRWAKVAWHDASWRFISLTDGKQPLQTWGTIPFLKLFPVNPLLAGRLFSVFSGLFALLGIFATGYYLFGKKAAYFGSLLYVFTPMFMFYDRMALVDSAVNGFAVWMFLLSIILARNVRLDIALLYGLLSGMALLAKSSVRLFLGLGFLALIMIKPSISRILNFSILYFLSSIIALVLYNIQRLSPFFHYIAQKNKSFVMTFDELLQNPFANFFNNIKIIPPYIFSEIGYVLGFLGIFGLLLLFKKDKRLALYFCFWIVIPFIIIAFISKVIFPRYLIFFAGLLTILAAFLLIQIKEMTKLIAIVISVVISVAYFDYAIIFNHKNIPFPPVDRGQYIEGITAGWGIRDLISYARDKSKEKRVIILAEGDFGVIGDQLEAHLTQNDNIFIKGFWPLKVEHVIENQKKLKANFVYVVFSHQKELPEGWPIRLIREYKKPGSQASIFFAEVLQ